MNSNELKEVLDKHTLFLKGKDGGDRATLRYADLRGTNLFGSNLIIYQSGLWEAYIQEDMIRIGCQYHSVKSWESFTDEEISKMHDDALRYWKENKEIILSIARRWMAIT